MLLTAVDTIYVSHNLYIGELHYASLYKSSGPNILGSTYIAKHAALHN